jgi:mannose-6-phosphate isomerase-like protein (cupin superfamily)
MPQYREPLGHPKGWLAGPWESTLPVSIGYASEGIDEPQVHPALAEVYLVARGSSRLRVGSETLDLVPASVVIVEAGEAHTFLASSSDYMHFVLHVPAPQTGSGAHKVSVDTSTLGF